MTRERLLVLHDSLDFGGHERAFLKWLPFLLSLEAVEAVTLLTPSARFREALAVHEGLCLEVKASPFHKLRGEPYRASFRTAYGRHIRALLTQSAATRTLLLQGRIENLAAALRWLPAQAPVISYIPMAHSGVEMGRNRVVAALGDRFKRGLYRRPNTFIAPSAAVARQLKRAGATAPILIVPNVPDAAQSNLSRSAARRALGLPETQLIALYMGRLDEHQKGLDRLSRALRAPSPALRQWFFRFVGEGTASNRLASVLASSKLRGRVEGWTSTPELEIAAADVVLMPSRFEGIPLVLLEALQAHTPVLASEIEEFRELLPQANRLDFSRSVDLATALEGVTTPAAQAVFRAHAAEVLSRRSVNVSGNLFAQAVLTPAEEMRA